MNLHCSAYQHTFISYLYQKKGDLITIQICLINAFCIIARRMQLAFVSVGICTVVHYLIVRKLSINKQTICFHQQNNVNSDTPRLIEVWTELQKSNGIFRWLVNFWYSIFIKFLLFSPILVSGNTWKCQL